MQLIKKRGLHAEYGNQADDIVETDTVVNEPEREEHTIEPEVQLPNVESQANNDSIVEEELRQRSRRTRNQPTRLVYNQLGRPQEQQNFFVSSVQPSLKKGGQLDPRLNPVAPVFHPCRNCNVPYKPLWFGPIPQNPYWEPTFVPYSCF